MKKGIRTPNFQQAKRWLRKLLSCKHRLFLIGRKGESNVGTKSSKGEANRHR